MAFYHSIYGMFVGVIQGSTLGTRPLYAKDGFVGPSLSVGPAGSEVAISGSAATVTPSTATTLTAGGLSILSSTAVKAYVIAAPAVGIVKNIFATAVTTAARTVTCASGQFQSTAQSTLATLTFDGAGQSLTLIGLSTAKYGVTSNMGVTLA